MLRCILREQRENYLPLRVIKDRIDSGEIDPTGEQPRPVDAPRGIKNVGGSPDVPQPGAHPSAGRARNEPSPNGADAEAVTGAAALFQRTDGVVTPAEAPAPAGSQSSTVESSTSAQPPRRDKPAADRGPIESAGAVLPGLLLDADELCAMAGISREQLSELEIVRRAGGLGR